MDLISVIIPVYNVEKYLKRCLDSVLKQSFQQYEIILVNDGSTDSSRAICEMYSEKYKEIFLFNQENGGLSAARNTGIEMAKGKYLTFLDSDDWIAEDYLEKLYINLVKTNSDIAVCDYLLAVEGEILSHKQTDEMEAIVYSQREIISVLHSTLDTQLIVAWGKLYKASIFKNLRFPVGRIHEDEFTTYLALFSAQRTVYIKQKLIFYWQRADSITGSKGKLKNKLDLLDAYYERIHFLMKNDFKKEYLHMLKRYIGLMREIDQNINQYEDKNDYFSIYLDKKKIFSTDIAFNNRELKLLIFIYTRYPKLLDFARYIKRMLNKK